MKKYFYDIHCHVMNLSHPNLIDFLKRSSKDDLIVSLNAIPVISTIITFFAKAKAAKLLNVISLMEHSICDYLLQMEKDLKNNKGEIIIADEEYEKVVICPLMMDFGNKINEKYDIRYKYDHKYIKDQLIDLFNGIADYRKTKPLNERKLEIYPFIGITPGTYKNKTNQEFETEILKKYFGDFKASENRHDKLLKSMGNFNGKITASSPSSYSFAGVKVYPPLGFDPYPDNDDELQKVELLYKYCCEKNIPIITHCGIRGYNTVGKNMKKLTDPVKWEKVLKKDEFKSLKICFAHYGSDFPEITLNPGKIFSLLTNKWGFTISKLMSKYENVYTDISAKCYKNKDYKKLRKRVKKHSKKLKIDESVLYKKILFGSDMMMILFKADSYKDYITAFGKTDEIEKDEKIMLSVTNPEAFLFG